MSVSAAAPAAAAAPSGRSLSAQLLRPLLLVWMLGLLAAGGGAFVLARQAADAAFDRGLQDETSALAAKVVWTDRGPLLDLSRQAMELLTWDQADRNEFAMQDSEGNPLAGDASVPSPTPAMRERATMQPLLFDASYLGVPVRGAVFSVRSPMLDRLVSVVVVETTNKRARVQRDILLGLLLPGLALGGTTFALLAWGIRRGVQPLRDVAAEVARRDADDWRPLSLAQVPAEAVPLIERINTLLDEVQQTLHLQRRFVADAAHQLRTPVAGLRVVAQELHSELAALRHADGNAGVEPAWSPLLTQIVSSTDRMNRLIGQLLSLARSEAALSIAAEHQRLDVVALLREAAEPLLLQGLRDGRSLSLEAPGEPVRALGHPLWLAEAVTNLLDNALRYGGPQITLRVAALPGGGAEVQVHDDGPGVPAEQLPRLFEAFWRGERADTRNDGGTGLGLAIAREIVERLGGTIEAHSRPDVDGMRFTIRLAG